ncbi:MAG TPA: hypothetical protein PKD77_11120 [Rudaea sp.]|mgnify:CR=1 FL=1|jgi:hypothetical protein|nr:hypothetical protein [Rudaea sp.]
MMPSPNRFVLIVLVLLAFAAGWYFWQSPAGTKPMPKPMAQEEPRPLTAPSTQQKPPRANAASSPATMAGDGTVAVPARYQFPGVERVRTAKNFKEWLAQFPPAQQSLITDFDKTHFSVYDTITSPEQVAWMAQHGYPMPEDILAATRMSDDDLKRLSDHGNDKAGFLLYERMAQRIRSRVDDYVASGGNKEQLLREDFSFALDAMKTATFLQSLYKDSESAYKGYAIAYDASFESDPLDRSSRIIAGLMWASKYGDSRASSDALSKYIQGNPELKREAAAASEMSHFMTLDQERLNCFPIAFGSRIPDKIWQ